MDSLGRRGRTVAKESNLPNPASAEAIVSAFLPNAIERRVALWQLVASADHAQVVAPAAWGVSLFQDLFRLNVGLVEVLVVGRGFIQLNCVGSIDALPFTRPHFEHTPYRSVPEPQCAYNGPIDQFATIGPDLQRPHRNFIEVVGRTRLGKPVAGSPHRKSHSADLMAYARSISAPLVEQFVWPDELAPSESLIEGAVCRITVNAYERNRDARRMCIAAHGTTCCICGFSFGMEYGPEADGYIHVHHVRPLSEIGGEYVVDPVEDLRPVCPNCHSVLHLDGRCRSIDEVRHLRARQRPAKPLSWPPNLRQ